MARKSAEIATLLRVQSWTVDEHRRMLGQMLGREEGLIEDGLRMDRELLLEQQVAAEAPTLAGHSYAAFAFNYRDRRANLEKLLALLRVEIEQQRDRLADAYRELKLLEEVRNNWRKAEQAERARIDQATMDEIAQNLYRLQHK
jgi:flagellar export protein FliJ